MNNIYQHYIIDLSSNNDFVQIPTVQGDGNNIRGFEVELIENGVQYEIDKNDCLVSIMGTKPDTSQIMNDCTVSDEGYILVDITSQMSAVKGRGDYQIVLMSRSTNSQLKSFPFYILTTPATFDIDYIVSSDEFQALTRNIVKTEDVIVETNDAISDMRALESSVSAAESIRISDENTRIQNEIEREQAEKTRIDAENVRITAENARMKSEQNRDNAENIRIANEETRETNETVRNNKETNRIKSEADRINAEADRTSAEEDRITSENTRKFNEDVRKANEESRITAESVRNEDEIARTDAETIRVANENDRINSEKIRNTNEINREQFEETRIDAENERKNAENVRETNENTRIENENNRKIAEDSRTAEETKRDNAENIRIDNESARQTNESLRQSNESDRQTNTALAISNTEKATDKANAAAEKASIAGEKATAAESTAIEKAADADNYAKVSQSYAVGTGNVRPDESTDNAKYYYEQLKAISENFADVLDIETELDNHIKNTTVHITELERQNWNAHGARLTAAENAISEIDSNITNIDTEIEALDARAESLENSVATQHTQIVNTQASLDALGYKSKRLSSGGTNPTATTKGKVYYLYGSIEFVVNAKTYTIPFQGVVANNAPGGTAGAIIDGAFPGYPDMGYPPGLGATPAVLYRIGVSTINDTGMTGIRIEFFQVLNNAQATSAKVTSCTYWVLN